MAKAQRHQPDELFPWLGRAIGARGPLACRGVKCEIDGTLTFELQAEEQKLTVSWRVAAPRAGERPYRDGSIAVDGGDALGATMSDTALTQVTGSLDAVLARWRLGLLDRRNRGLHGRVGRLHLLDLEIGPSTPFDLGPHEVRDDPRRGSPGG